MSKVLAGLCKGMAGRFLRRIGRAGERPLPEAMEA